jgi:hypothetical protein
MTAGATSKAKAAEAAKHDMGVINPEVRALDIAGVPCRVRRVRTRELLLFIRVVTAGGSYSMAKVDFKDRTQIAALLLMAVPEAHAEFLELLRVLVEPVEHLEPTDERYLAFTEQMENPEVEVTMDVIEAVVAQEQGTFEALWGKAQTLLKMRTALGKS